ncbi:MAG: YCF48-related protein [Bacteroidota bacterium]
MKGPGFLLSVMMIMLVMTVSCSKKNDDPQTVTKKPYAWVAGERDSTGYGMILFSADSGETWVRQGQGSSLLKDIDVWDIWAVDENTVWAVCSENVILKTLNGGKTWTQVPAPTYKTVPRLSSISIVNKTNIWISGSGGAVFNSTDNGNSWTVFDTNTFHNGLMQGVWAVNPQKVYVAGGVGNNSKYKGFIGYTLDGGITWDSVSPADDYNRNEWIGVTSCGNTIVVYGGKAHYMVSTDGGGSWKNDSVLHTGGVTGADINHMIMLNSGTWWGAFDLSEVFLTTNGGSSWVSQPAIKNGEFNVGIDSFNGKLALTVGELSGWPKKGSIMKTSDGGTTWKNVHTYSCSLSKVSFIKQ